MKFPKIQKKKKISVPSIFNFSQHEKARFGIVLAVQEKKIDQAIFRENKKESVEVDKSSQCHENAAILFSLDFLVKVMNIVPF